MGITFQRTGRIEMALPLLKIERGLARRRQKLGGMYKSELRPNLGEGGKVTEIVAKKIGVARGLLEQALWLRENVPEEELEKLRRGATSGSWLSG
jgi:hypothetical protein